MASFPDPLTRPDSDLRSFDWFPLYHKRLVRSSFWVNASAEAKAASVDLWCEAYQQVPAGSMPDDDAALALTCGFGRREIDQWKAIKAEVMSAWLKCSDGRWYHPTLCEVVNEAWDKKLEMRDRDRARKAAYRAKKPAIKAKKVSHTLDDTTLHDTTPTSPIGEAFDASKSLLPVVVKDAKATRAKKLPVTTLPDEWEPTEREIEYGERLGFTAERVYELAENFKTHHGHKQTLGAKWTQAFQGWLRKEREWKGTSNGSRTGASARGRENERLKDLGNLHDAALDAISRRPG